ncbi:SLC13 family permease [Maridesulfovibrio salexigens]|uniref:Sodium/sulphate symporter n=1 Tax=Maridesulfovibrio salexigens (strain ATCC 14822 / DSM 2638 / NCIMB 8403 / VKM B-1763) TaxID=526222 RepID=C6BS11_MARSD|nr:SLC13 family permease [Maridesulfovibrio salexigens]ACS81394.1 sodium/sulphate symporter [Maridesulfovibrio salexigens DSM 2638]
MNYIYGRLPLILLFVTGYILYRVTASTALPEYVSARAVRFSRGRTDYLLLSLMGVAAMLSMFIPNAVTVLAMIPVIRKLDDELESMTTPLTLSIIYGANIGGMGSLIGSPANLLLIGALDLFDIPGRMGLTFFNWFEWALPLVVLMLLLGWFVVRLSLSSGGKSIAHAGEIPRLDLKQRKGLIVFSLFLLFWSVSSVLTEMLPAYRANESLVAVAFFVAFSGYVFGSGLLSVSDLVQGIPSRGVLFLGLLGLLIVLVRMFELDKSAASLFTGILDALGQSGEGFGIYLVTALIVILLTEFLSNTVVSTAFFAVIAHVGVSYGLNPLPLMILVSAASTCAFMTPVATPCNSLAVGEMRGMSLKTMFALGMLLNVLGALVLSFWIWSVVPLVYR